MHVMKKAVFIVLFLLAGIAGGRAQEVIVPGDNLALDGIPAIPASLADDVGRYTEFRSAGFSGWHPILREMLISTRFGDVNQTHLVKFPGGARTQITFSKDAVSGATFDRKNGDFIVFSMDRGGDEQYQKYRYDFSTGKTALLTDGASRNTGGAWSNSGDRIAYHSTRRNGKDTDLYTMRPADPKSDSMLTLLEGGGWSALDWSPDDRRILLMETISINESYLWIVDVKTGGKKLLTPKGGKKKVSYKDAAFDREGKGIYVSTDRLSEFSQFGLMDPSSLNIHVLTGSIPWDVDGFSLSEDRTRAVFVVNENGAGVLHIMDLMTGAEIPAPKMPAGIIGGFQWHSNGKEIGFSFTSARSASDVYSFNIETGVLERWTFSETAGLNTELFSEAELVEWKSFDGRMISGFLYNPGPAFTGKRPVIVEIHGGPEGQARPGFQGRKNYWVNEMGIAILQPNVRGSSGYGKTFLKLDNGFLREDSYKDIEALFEWIRTRPDLDADRVLVTGGSYGGHMTLAVASLYSDRIRCSVSVVGISNLVTFLENTSGYRQDLRRVEYGDERDPEMRAFLQKIAPLNRADRIGKPLFIIQGANDPRVPASEAAQMMSTLKEKGVPAWYLLAKDEGHGFAKKKNQDFQFYSTILFMRAFLLR
jgi:dipeptidyl aminopeptidase/acylaminoacyl peptidase